MSPGPASLPLFTGVRGIEFLGSSLAGSWIKSRNTPPRCPWSGPIHARGGRYYQRLDAYAGSWMLTARPLLVHPYPTPGLYQRYLYRRVRARWPTNETNVSTRKHLCTRTQAHNTRRYGRPLAGDPWPIGVGLWTMSMPNLRAAYEICLATPSRW
jgi:hypothetical protein